MCWNELISNEPRLRVTPATVEPGKWSLTTTTISTTTPLMEQIDDTSVTGCQNKNLRGHISTLRHNQWPKLLEEVHKSPWRLNLFPSYPPPGVLYDSSPSWCYGKEMLSMIFSNCHLSGIRSCGAPKCVARTKAFAEVAAQCDWKAFRDLILTSLGCGVLDYALYMFDIILVVNRKYSREDSKFRQNDLSCIPHQPCLDVHGAFDIIRWAMRLFMPPEDCGAPDIRFLMTRLQRGYEMKAIKSVEKCRRQRDICPNRLWNLSYVAENGVLELSHVARLALASIPASQTIGQQKHAYCTEQTCLFSHDNTTLVQQVHKCAASLTCTMERTFPPEELNKCFSSDEGAPTAWVVGQPQSNASLVSERDFYIAISHVWSDGTGSGMKDPGKVNECLWGFFENLARLVNCTGIWWDAICIPSGRDQRRRAMNVMLGNYEKAAVTIVHDLELLDFEWKEDGSPAVALVLSAWFTRGWTAAELWASRSHPVKVLFKDSKSPDEPILKDLDEDILRLPRSSMVHYGHFLAADIIRMLRPTDYREQKINTLEKMLGLLRSRTTSWEKDRLLIPGLMQKVLNYNSKARGPEITQRLLTSFSSSQVRISDLFHTQVPMARTGPWSWCPPSIFDLGSLSSTLEAQALPSDNKATVARNGTFRATMTGYIVWPDDTVVPCSSHTRVVAQINSALTSRDYCLLLAVPRATTNIRQYFLVTVVGDGPLENTNDRYVKCRWVGCVFMRPTSEIEMSSFKNRQLQLTALVCEFGTDVDTYDNPLPNLPVESLLRKKLG